MPETRLPARCCRLPRRISNQIDLQGMSQPSDETTDPIIADQRNYYRVEKWTKDTTKVDRLRYAGDNLEKARDVFPQAVKHRQRIRLAVRQQSYMLHGWLWGMGIKGGRAGRGFRLYPPCPAHSPTLPEYKVHGLLIRWPAKGRGYHKDALFSARQGLKRTFEFQSAV